MKKHQLDLHKSQAQQATVSPNLPSDFVYVFNLDAIEEAELAKIAKRKSPKHDDSGKMADKIERKQSRAKKYGYTI